MRGVNTLRKIVTSFTSQLEASGHRDRSFREPSLIGVIVLAPAWLVGLGDIA